MLEWLEASAVARLVQETLWGYPIVLSSHAVGMALLAGLALMINFRVLGGAPDITLSALATLHRFAWIGFVINAVSGTMLFVSNADAFVRSTPFWIKIGLLTVAMTLFVLIGRRMASHARSQREQAIPRSVRMMAGLSTFAWLGVVVMGRLIAYWDWNDS